MASPKFSSLILCVVVVVAICAVNLADGTSSPHKAAAATPSPSADCQSVIVHMVDCLSFVSNGSTETKPKGTCCSGLKNVLDTAPLCLCEAFKSSSQFGVVLNVSKALTLPALCKLTAPPLTACGLSQAPGAAPGGSLSPQTSPSVENEPSPAAPAPAKAASAALLPISAGTLLVCILSVFLSL